MTYPPLRGRACECPTCGLRFTGVEGFDGHRTGKYGVRDGADRRRCMPEAEMLAAGLVHTPRGWQRSRQKAPVTLVAAGNRGVAA